MRLVRDKSIHLNLIQRAKLVSDEQKQHLIADVQQNGITEENEPILHEVYQAEMRRIDDEEHQLCKQWQPIIDNLIGEVRQAERDMEDQYVLSTGLLSPPAPEGFLGFFGRFWRLFNPGAAKDKYQQARCLIQWEVEDYVRDKRHQFTDPDPERIAATVCGIVDHALSVTGVVAPDDHE